MAEAKTRRLLRLAGGLVLILAPRGVADAGLDRASLRAPRPGSIRISPTAPVTHPSLELDAPDLLRPALQTEVGGGWERSFASAAVARGRAPTALLDLAPLESVARAAEPVAEPPAALLLSVAAGGWLAARRSAQLPKRGARFSRNASMPSTASGSSRLSAITAPASR